MTLSVFNLVPDSLSLCYSCSHFAGFFFAEKLRVILRHKGSTSVVEEPNRKRHYSPCSLQYSRVTAGQMESLQNCPLTNGPLLMERVNEVRQESHRNPGKTRSNVWCVWKICYLISTCFPSSPGLEKVLTTTSAGNKTCLLINF